MGVRTKGDANKRRTRKKKGGNTVPCALHVLTRDVRVLGVFPFFSGASLVALWDAPLQNPRATPSQGLLLIKRRKREAITGQ